MMLYSQRLMAKKHSLVKLLSRVSQTPLNNAGKVTTYDKLTLSKATVYGLYITSMSMHACKYTCIFKAQGKENLDFDTHLDNKHKLVRW